MQRGSEEFPSSPSIAVDKAPLPLELSALTLAFKTPASCGSGDLGDDAPTWRKADAAKPLGELVQGILLVLSLGPVAIAGHDEITGTSHVRREGFAQSAFLGEVQSLSCVQLEAKLDLGRDLVDVLTAGAATPHVAKFEVGLRNVPVRVDLEVSHDPLFWPQS